MRTQLMECDGEIYEATSATAIDGGAAYMLKGVRYTPYASFETATAYTQTPTPTEDNLLKVSLPMPLNTTLFPTPVLWISQEGLEAFYNGKRMASRHGVVVRDEDEVLDDASSVSSMESEIEDAEEGEEGESDASDDESDAGSDDLDVRRIVTSSLS